jgi:hypothetical protein
VPFCVYTNCWFWIHSSLTLTYIYIYLKFKFVLMCICSNCENFSVFTVLCMYIYIHIYIHIQHCTFWKGCIASTFGCNHNGEQNSNCDEAESKNHLKTNQQLTHQIFASWIEHIYIYMATPPPWPTSFLKYIKNMFDFIET